MHSLCCQSVLDAFFYFAYGSNLLKKRIHINNPSAEFFGIGKLNDHSVTFSDYSNNWCGAVATIIPVKGASVWGAIWKLNKDNLPSLDKQEGVDTNTYFPKTVIIVKPDGNRTECRTYQLTQLPPRSDPKQIPIERRPSMIYLDCIVKGAIECELPEEYIEKLKKIPQNGREAKAELKNKLNS